MQSSYSVLICGAGPTGLMMAAQLLRFGVPFLIVDKKSKPTTESRAVVVQARSLEIYEQLGLIDRVLSEGKRATGFCFWRKGKKIADIALKGFGDDITPYNFVFLYEQSKNEMLLYDHLQKGGAEVEWNTELLSYRQYEGGNYKVTLQKDGSEITVTTPYLIACDGAKSKVREDANMDFSGGTYQQVFYVADTHVAAPVCDDKMNFFTTKNSFHILFPMAGTKRFRAIGILPPQFYHQNQISFTEVSQQVNKEAAIDLGFYDTQWYSTYRLHHKKVKSFNRGNIFFCGDAAHVHSPAGGQGMNTGLQDAYNLAWKLALVVHHIADNNLLSTYHEERNLVAERLLRTTDRMFSAMSKNTLINKLFRLYLFPAVAPFLMKIKRVRRRLFRLVSQTEIAYTDSSLSYGKIGAVKAGMRLPYVMVSANNKWQSIYEFVCSAAAEAPFLLLAYNVDVQGFSNSNLIYLISLESNEYNQKAFAGKGFSTSFVLLLRPDNYIAYVANTFQQEIFLSWFRSAYGLL